MIDRSARGDKAAAKLSQLSQGKTSMTDIAIRFVWNEPALCFRFH